MSSKSTIFGSFRLLLSVVAILAGFSVAQQHKELGRMWTFENPPLDYFQEVYGFSPTQPWLDHARLSSLRYGQGCSASFVSPRGLIMTNNHCARDNVVAVSPAGKDWLNDGFFATSLAEEVPVPGLTVQQLVSMKDVTALVNEGAAAAGTDDERSDIVAKNIARLESEAESAQPELDAQVVTLYQGGMYQLYMYRIYKDVRLVAFPQLQAAKFGGDPDNFTYPRFSLDCAFVRAWEDGKPADTSAHFFRWKTEGPKEGELVFVTGNPGSTGRLNTVAQMEYLRDAEYPAIITNVKRQLDGLYKAEKKQKDAPGGKVDPALTEEILGLENARKAYMGYLDGLKNPTVMEVKRTAEAKLREQINGSEEWKAKFGGAWEKLEALTAEKTELLQKRPSGWRQPFLELGKQEESIAKTIGEAFFAVYGTQIPPDATFTLRISDGVVTGFPMNGTIAPWFTSLYGLYARHCEFEGKDPFNLPDIWIQRRDRLDMTTRFNLVSTCDIIGGNSGSPMINKDLQVVGLVFDGNIESLGNRFVFTDDVPRTVCVHPAIIIEALRRVYDAPRLADEIEGKGPGYE